MRLLELQLLAYGPFTNLSIDLRSREPGLHVIFGPNEAGKSAALRALQGLLYGIPMRTDDDFLHGKTALRIGARIRGSTGAELAFVRQKRRSNTLLNPNTGAAYPDDVLEPFLGGVDEGTFARVYGIGHERLVEGGEELRKMRGLAGESLFAAGMGGVALSDVLRTLHDEAAALRPVRGGKLKSYLDDYKAARSEKDEASRPAHRWEKLEGELAELQGARTGVLSRLAQRRAEHARCERLIRAVALVGQRRNLLAALEGQQGVRVLPASYSPADRREAAGRLALRPKVEQMRAELEGLRAQLAALVIPEDLLRQADVIDSMRQRLGAHLKAAKDLSGLRTQRDLLHAEALDLLRELRPGAGWDQIDTLRLAPDRKVRIQNLAAQEKQAREQPAVLATREARAAATLGELQRELTGLGATHDAGPLARALRVVRKHGDLDRQRADVARELRQVSDKAERALQRLGLETGVLPTVDALPLPSTETVERFTRAFAGLDEEGRVLLAAARENEDRAEQTAREIAVLRKSRDVPSEASLHEARSQRDAGWALVRGQWLEGRDDAEAIRRYAGDLGLADAYEGRVSDADEVADRLRREADDVAQLANLQATEEQLAGKRAILADEAAELELRRADLSAEWSAAWAPAAVAPRSPAEMRAWLSEHAKIVLFVQELRTRRGMLEELEGRIAADRVSLLGGLSAVQEPPGPPDESLAALVERCEDVCERLAAAAKHRADLDKDIHKQQAERDDAARDRVEAEGALARWREEWLGAVAGIGCDADTTGPEANERISRIDLLLSKVRDVGDRDRRIEGIQSDARDLTREVSGLAERVAADLGHRPVEEVIGELVGRLDKARQDTRALATLTKEERKLAGQLAETEQSLAEAQATLAELCRLAGVEKIEQLEEAETQSAELSKGQDRLAAINESLSQLAADQSVEEFVSGAEDPDALSARRAALADEIETLETERTALDHRSGEIRNEMEAFDGSGRAAEADEKALGILARIREGAERYILLEVAEAFLLRQVERHRAATQDPILTRAGQLFGALTCGAFEGLRTDQDQDDQPIVVGVRPGGAPHLTVEQMSDGTADQLYLALRLAYLEQQLDNREPLPFVFDDILVNFDDHRAEATLRVLGELGRRTQVLLFTHHERNVDLARSAVPKELLGVHRLA